jgi:hypothetical protein
MRSHAASALLLALALLTGCGSATDPATSSRRATAGRAAPIITSGPELYTDVARRMAGEGTATFTFSGVGGGETVSGSGAMHFGFDQFDAEVELTMPETGRVRAVLMPDASYLALPHAKGLPKKKPWLKVAALPKTAIGRELRPVVDQLRASFDPEQSLGLLQAARRVEEVGPATVEGEPTTRYHARVGLRQAIQQTAGLTREQYAVMLEAGVRTLDYDVWLDATGLPRKFTADIPTASGLFSVTGTYRDWGKKVRIEQPTAKEIFDADKLKG